MQNTLPRIAIAGANGRMGRQLIAAALATPEVRLAAAFVRGASSLVGTDAGELAGAGKCGVRLADSPGDQAGNFDVLIDFTRPQNTRQWLDFCCQHKKALVIGTTGFTEEDKAAIAAAGRAIPLVMSANFSIGVNLLLTLLEKASRVMGQDSDIEIIEAHHRHKVDAPSGTALAMGETIAHTLGKSLAECAVYHRQGVSAARPAGSIGFASVRAGDIVGEHTALFATDGERLEISHKASNRMTFARGAIRAARWLRHQQNGLYSMAQVLNL